MNPMDEHHDTSEDMGSLAKEQSTDAMRWAEAFCRQWDGYLIAAESRDDYDPVTDYIVIDPGYMVGVFANAMAAAESVARRQLADRIVELWNANDGWIPGADYENLALVLGLIDPDVLLEARMNRQVPPEAWLSVKPQPDNEGKEWSEE